MKFKVAVLMVLAAAGGWSQTRVRPIKFAARGTRGAVAGGCESSTEAGMRMYYAGGNAVDAGIATMLAAAVAEFSNFGFMFDLFYFSLPLFLSFYLGPHTSCARARPVSTA